MELHILFNEVEKRLAPLGINVRKAFVGNFMTSLEMAGASVTLLKLDEELAALLAAPCSTPALKI